MSDLLPITFHKIVHSKSYTLFILDAEGKQFPIYAEPSVGANIQSYVNERLKSRPFTHDLLVAMIKGFDINLDQIVISDINETVYFAELYLSLKMNEVDNILKIDARPSDCLTLALMTQAPIFCKRELLEKISN